MVSSLEVEWSPQLTRVRLFGILLALTTDDKDKDQQENKYESNQGDDHQEPPLFIEWISFLG